MQPQSSQRPGSPANADALPVVNSIFDFSAEALGELKTWFEGAGIAIPITQILGFQQFTAQFAKVDTAESTTSTTYVDLATVGPSITGLSNGKYVFLFSILAYNTSGTDQAVAGLSLNGASPIAGDELIAGGGATNQATHTAFAQATLMSGNNAVRLRYKSTLGGAANFQYRRLIALRFSNA